MLIRLLGRSSNTVEQARPYLLALLVGTAAGGAAIVFRELISDFDDIFYGTIGGLGTWKAVLVPAAGGLLVGPLIYFFAREAKGHGVPEVMLAVEREGGRIRGRVAVVKALASAITIGSGGSVGREGPIAQISSAVASTLGQVVRLPDDQIRLLVAAGAAGGISATFNAPIAGVFFALEVILRHFNVRNFSVIVISAVTAAVVGHAYFGDNPAFAIPAYRLENAVELPLYALLGVICAFVATLFIKVLYGAEDAFDALPLPEWSKAAVGGFGIGILGLWYVELLGVGYGSGPGANAIPSALSGEKAFETLALLAGLKILATSLTVGSGGSGGVFAPSLFIGAMAGGAFGSAVNELLPRVVAPPGAYATVGMAAVFAGAARAPMTAILILFEMTRDYSIILPLMTSVVIAAVMGRLLFSESIYTLKLRRRGILLREAREGPILAELPVSHAMQTDVQVVGAADDAAQLLNLFGRNGHDSAFPVLDEHGWLVGIVTSTDVERAVESGLDITALSVGDLATKNPVTIYPEQSLHDAVRRMSAQSLRQLPVVSRAAPNVLLGMVRRSDIFQSYAEVSHARPAEGRGPGMLAGLEAYGSEVIELRVSADSPLADKKLAEIGLPGECVVASVIRQGSVVIPRGTTTLREGDLLLLVGAPGSRQALLQSLTGK